MIVIGTIK